MAQDKVWTEMARIMELIDQLLNETPEQHEARVRAEAAAQKRRIANRNARFAQMLSYASDIQAVRINKLEADGMKVAKAWQNRSTGKICVMLQKDNVFNQKTYRMGTKLAMVYPDGTWMEEFGKISIQEHKLA